MKISNAEITPDGISLAIPRDDARRFVYGFKPGEYEIKKTRKKRSLDANAYAWKLIDEISLATRISPKTVYRRALEDVPTIRYTLLVADEDVENAIDKWALISGAPVEKAKDDALSESLRELAKGLTSDDKP